MTKRHEIRRVVQAGLLVGSLSVTGGLAVDVVGAVAPASASLLPSVDCSQSYGGSYLATVSGNQATVVLGSDCTADPYYLVVYTAQGNAVGPAGAYPDSGDSFPLSQDYPEYIYPQSSGETATSFAPSTGGTQSATVNLPDSCWQLDVFTLAAPYNDYVVPSELTAVDNLGSPPLVWGENGPYPGSCTPPAPPSTMSPLTIGYWKHWNTAVLGSNPNTHGNPIMDTYLPQSLGSYEVTTAAQGVAVLSDPSGKYAEDQLAAQLLAAELNVAANATSCPAATSAITEGNSLLSAISYSGPPSSAVGPGNSLRAEFVDTASTLNSYNNNQLC